MVRVCTPFLNLLILVVRVCYGPSVLLSEFVMVRVCYGPSCPVTSQTIKSRTVAEKALRRPGMLCNFMRDTYMYNRSV
jgi:hypothetical protein